MKRAALVLALVLALPAAASDIKGNIVVDVNLAPLITRLLGRSVDAFLNRGECKISTVGFRYSGQPGQTFEDSGEQFTTDERGQAEIIATRRDSRRSDEPVDQFGFADRELPMPKVRAKR